jgi:hypothetical protein
VLLTISPKYGYGIECYVCNSAERYEGEACKIVKNDTTSNQFLKNCNVEFKDDGLNYTRCRKMIQDVEGEVRVVRSCATWPAPEKPNKCVDRTGTTKIKIHYCECSEDKCNEAVAIQASIISVASLAIFINVFIF